MSGNMKYGSGNLKRTVWRRPSRHALLAVDGHRRRRRGHQVLVPVDVLEPEHEVVGGEGLAVAPLHAAPQVHDPRAAAVLHLEALGDIRHDLVAGVVPEHQMVGARAAAEAVPEVGRPGEAAAPDAAVLADLVQRLDDQRVLADALGHRRQLAGLHLLRELRRFLERLGELGGVGDDLRAFQLADQRLLPAPCASAPAATAPQRTATTSTTVSRDRSVRFQGQSFVIDASPCPASVRTIVLVARSGVADYRDIPAPSPGLTEPRP